LDSRVSPEGLEIEDRQDLRDSLERLVLKGQPVPWDSLVDLVIEV